MLVLVGCFNGVSFLLSPEAILLGSDNQFQNQTGEEWCHAAVLLLVLLLVVVVMAMCNLPPPPHHWMVDSCHDMF